MSARMFLSVCSEGRYTVGRVEPFLGFAMPRLLAMRSRGVACLLAPWQRNKDMMVSYLEEKKAFVVKRTINNLNQKEKAQDSLTNFFMDLVFLPFRLFLLTPVLAALPLLPAEDVLLTFLRLSVQI